MGLHPSPNPHSCLQEPCHPGWNKVSTQDRRKGVWCYTPNAKVKHPLVAQLSGEEGCTLLLMGKIGNEHLQGVKEFIQLDWSTLPPAALPGSGMSAAAARMSSHPSSAAFCGRGLEFSPGWGGWSCFPFSSV